MESTLRKRNNDGHSNNKPRGEYSGFEKSPKSKLLDGFVLFASLAAVYGLVWLFVHVRLAQFPKPTDVGSAKLSDFVETRARKHLDEITKLGPRVAGSDSQEASAQYIVEEIAKIRSAAKNVHTFETDIQIVSGTFNMDFESIGLGSYPSVYENQENVVVRIGPKELTHSLLVNCHYDSVVDSPGTSDDAVSCAVMLEVLHALSKQDEALPHNIIFLFNGAEENILQTSHGFITQHKWASSIRAFVNLESAGAGGWELLFQTGPDHPWLIETYIASAPYPHSSVIGQEIFQLGLVPSDTDFRIFRDYGKIPGLDLAHIRNGYVYHTPNDLPHFVEPGCMQRTGDNILALVKSLVASPYLVDPGNYRHGTLVFFDFLGFFVVAYPQRLAVILNWAVMACVFIMTLRKAVNNSHDTKTWLMYQLAAVGAVAATWVILLGTAVVMGMFMTAIGRDMSYFTHDTNVLWLFVCPSVAAALAFHVWLKNSFFSTWRGIEVADLYFEANLLLWSVVVGVLTWRGVMSAYAPLMFVCGPLLAHFVARVTGLPMKDMKVYSAVTVAGTLIPQVYITYMGFTLLTFFIPIMGRVGTEERPDIAVAVMTMLPVVMVIPFQVGLVYLTEKMSKVVKGLLVVTLVGVLAIIFTPLGFPFSFGDAPSKQRILFVHSDRQFHSRTGEVTKRDSSIWLKPFDHVGVSYLQKEAPHLFRDAKIVECEGLYCGRPYLYPVLARIDARKTWDLPAPPMSAPRLEARLVKTSKISDDVRRLQFELTGPDHMTVFISALPVSHIVSWSFGHYEPVVINTLPALDDGDRDTHFVYYAYGRKPSKPWTFHIDLYTPPTLDKDAALVDISFAGHYMHGKYHYTEAMKDFVKQLPAWTTPSGWSSTLDVYQF